MNKADYISYMLSPARLPVPPSGCLSHGWISQNRLWS